MNMGSYFRIRIDDLPAEVDALKDFCILSGETLTPVLQASARASSVHDRILLISTLGQSTPLASIAPRTNHTGHVSQDLYAFGPGCLELLIYNQAHEFWGTFSVDAQDTYTLTRLGQTLLQFYGDRESRCLTAVQDSETVALLNRIDDYSTQYLEVGVFPQIDSILILLCFLGTAIFNPGGDLSGSEMNMSKSSG